MADADDATKARLELQAQGGCCGCVRVSAKAVQVGGARLC